MMTSDLYLLAASPSLELQGAGGLHQQLRPYPPRSIPWQSECQLWHPLFLLDPLRPQVLPPVRYDDCEPILSPFLAVCCPLLNAPFVSSPV